jgi:hypothetical protein
MGFWVNEGSIFLKSKCMGLEKGFSESKGSFGLKMKMCRAWFGVLIW